MTKDLSELKAQLFTKRDLAKKLRARGPQYISFAKMYEREAAALEAEIKQLSAAQSKRSGPARAGRKARGGKP